MNELTIQLLQPFKLVLIGILMMLAMCLGFYLRGRACQTTKNEGKLKKFKKYKLTTLQIFATLIVFTISFFTLSSFFIEPLIVDNKYDLLIDLLGIFIGVAGAIGVVVWYILKKETEKQIKKGVKRLSILLLRSLRLPAKITQVN